MAAPFIIPFNNQPVQTVATTASYTVPAGKYSKVSISNAILPVLNSVNLYTTKTQPNAGFSTSGLTMPFMPTDNVHRIFIQKDGNSGAQYYSFGIASATATVSSAVFVIAGANASINYDFSTPSKVESVSGVGTGIPGSTTSVIYYTCSIQELWLKAGDVFTYSAGSIVYSEYNIIS